MLKNLTRLVSFRACPSTSSLGKSTSNAWKLGVLSGNQVLDLSSIDPSIPSDLKSVLQQDSLLRNIRQLSSAIPSNQSHLLPLSDLQIGSPIHNPEKVVCVGLNYQDHAQEAGLALPADPVLFSKFASSIIGQNDEIIKPEETSELDYEVELVVVIGREGRRISPGEAFNYVAGYTVGNDVSARDWQLKRAGGQWLMGKTWDTFAPIGPAVLLTDPSFDPHKLGVRCYLNGNLMQNSSTSNLHFKIDQLLWFISKIVTLKPGDLIFTGTPGGVGMARKPPVFMKHGDLVECEIDLIGKLSNKVVSK